MVARLNAWSEKGDLESCSVLEGDFAAVLQLVVTARLTHSGMDRDGYLVRLHSPVRSFCFPIGSQSRTGLTIQRSLDSTSVPRNVPGKLDAQGVTLTPFHEVASRDSDSPFSPLMTLSSVTDFARHLQSARTISFVIESFLRPCMMPD
jgi:hypothetical protein